MTILPGFLPDRPGRKARRNHPDFEPAPQITEVHEDDYITLHPTKGWRRVSNARIAAQTRMAHILDHVLPFRPKKPAKVWRKPAPPAPSVETRQQRRRAARLGPAFA